VTDGDHPEEGGSEAEPEAEATPKAEVKPEAEATPKAEVKPEAEAKAAPEAESAPNAVKPEPESTPKAAVKPEAESTPKADVKPEAESTPKATPEAGPESKAAPLPVAAARPDRKGPAANGKPGARPELKADVQQPARTLGFWHGLTALRRATPSWLAYLLGALCVLCVFVVWWFVTRGEAEFRIMSPTAVPSPEEAFKELRPLKDRGLMKAIVASFRRVVFGFGLSMIFGIGIGIIAASLRPVQAFFRPMVMFGRSIPLAALIPLTGAIFKYGETSKIMFIFIATVPFVFSDTVAAVLTIPERYVDTARTLGASRFQIIRKVLVPLALPEIFTGMRFLFGLAFGYIMLAESLIIETGLGALIQQSMTRGGEKSHVFLLLIIIALLAYGVDRLLLFFQRGLFPYRSDF
jgi:ABC-type nitrate/sulfonate/bicarbonate transport system permease component